MNTHIIANNAAFTIIDIAINEFNTKSGEYIHQNSIASKFQEYGLDWDTTNKGLSYAQENGWLEYKSPNIIINQSAFDEASKGASLKDFLESDISNFRHEKSLDPSKNRLFHCSQNGGARFSIYYGKSWLQIGQSDSLISVVVSGVRGVSEEERKIPAKESESGKEMIHFSDRNLSGIDYLISEKICEILNIVIGNRNFPIWD